MVGQFLLWAWLSASAQSPPEPPLPSAVPAEAPIGVELPYGEVLAAAKAAWFEGRSDDALVLLKQLQIRLHFGEHPPQQEMADTLIYLGEIQYNAGEWEAASATWRQLLTQYPDQSINPFEHPDAIVRRFELLRDAVKEELSRSETPMPPVPIWGYMPFGVPQFGQGQAGRGAVYLTLQAGFATTSLLMIAHLQRLNGSILTPNSIEEEGGEYPDPSEIRTKRWLIQVPASLAFYAAWSVSVADGHAHWRASAVVTPAPAISGTPARGGMLRLSVEF